MCLFHVFFECLRCSCFQRFDLLPLVIDYLSGQLFAPLGFLQLFAVMVDLLFCVLLGKLDGFTSIFKMNISIIKFIGKRSYV